MSSEERFPKLIGVESVGIGWSTVEGLERVSEGGNISEDGDERRQASSEEGFPELISGEEGRCSGSR